MPSDEKSSIGSGFGKSLLSDDFVPKHENKDNSKGNNTESDNSENLDVDSNDSSSLNSSGSSSRKFGEYNSLRVRNFLIRLAMACKRHEIRVNARKQFYEHADKIKQNLISGKPHEKPDEEIESLKKKVEYLISIEKGSKNHASDEQLNEKIGLLEGKLNILLKSKLEKEKRFEELEKKMNLKHKQEKGLIEELERKLLFLERKLIEHQIDVRKNKKKTDSDAVNQIKNQIDKTKQALHKIKS